MKVAYNLAGHYTEDRGWKSQRDRVHTRPRFTTTGLVNVLSFLVYRVVESKSTPILKDSNVDQRAGELSNTPNEGIATSNPGASPRRKSP